MTAPRHGHHPRARLGILRLVGAAVAVVALAAVVALSVAQTTGTLELPGLGHYGQAPGSSVDVGG